ncbi:hypothetical protein [Chryseobacterium gambrini]|uniref:Uncharacterized protein n=1 Tax=Chryseobacterium gambrini TaxID=373672 RepID=A0ABM8K7K4_9FLAO|nr:hypothetical protein CRDW_23930 [Chryseobacterium gambrini]
MKKQYSIDDLANVVLNTITFQYNNPERIFEDLKGNIKRKVKSLHRRELTEKEIITYSMTIANDVFKDLRKITTNIISTKLSKELIDKSRSGEFELSEYKDYFSNFAKEMVKQLLQAKFNYIKNSIKNLNNHKIKKTKKL